MCDAEGRTYRILTGSSDLDRPIVIVDPQGFKVFSFAATQIDLASEILHRLNNPSSEWMDAA
jgi:hypothetical protein